MWRRVPGRWAMGRASRRKRERRADDSVLRELGQVYVSGPDGEERRVVGPEAEAMRQLMQDMCPICSQGASHHE
jgi:hypothetical protein